MAKKDFSEMSKKILENVGGKENISYLTHCVTRLRLNVRDKSLVNVEAVGSIPNVLGSTWSGEQYQIIIGQSVGDLYKVVCKDAGVEEQALVDENLDTPKKKSGIDALFDAISGCITPVIPVLIGSGMIKVLILLLELIGVLEAGMPTHTVLTFVGDAGFYFLPIFIGYTAAKKFGGNALLGALMGAILIHPTFVACVADGTALSFLGLPIFASTYASMIFPSILSVFIMCKVERFIGKISPDSIRSVTEPLFTILIMVPIMLCVTGPVGVYIGNFVTAAIMWIYDTLGFVGVAILAGAWPILILTGMHTSTGTYLVQAFASLGYDPIVCAASFTANLSMGAACLGVAAKSKKANTKSTGISFAVTAILGGVTEPALFGMVSKNKKTLFSACLGGVVGGAIAGLFKVAAYAFPGAGGLPGIPCFIGPTATNIIVAIIAMVASMVVSCILSYITYQEE